MARIGSTTGSSCRDRPSPEEDVLTVVRVADSPKAFKKTTDGKIQFRVKVTGSVDERWKKVFSRLAKQDLYRQMSLRLEKWPVRRGRFANLEFNQPPGIGFDVVFTCEEEGVPQAFSAVQTAVVTVNTKVAEGLDTQRSNAEERRQAADEAKAELQRLTNKFKYLSPQQEGATTTQHTNR